MNRNEIELMAPKCYNKGKVRGYYIKLFNSPAEHYVFVEIDTDLRVSFLCWSFNLVLN